MSNITVQCAFCGKQMTPQENIYPVRVFGNKADKSMPHYVPCCSRDCADALIEKQMDTLYAQYKIISEQKVTPISIWRYIGAGPVQPKKATHEKPGLLKGIFPINPLAKENEKSKTPVSSSRADAKNRTRQAKTNKSVHTAGKHTPVNNKHL